MARRYPYAGLILKSDLGVDLIRQALNPWDAQYTLDMDDLRPPLASKPLRPEEEVR